MDDINKAVSDASGDADKKVARKKMILSYLHDLTYLLAGMLLVFLLLFRVVVVSGSSMNMTLLDGDYLLLLNNVFYKDPKPGDVIVATKESFGEPIIKRVIATEGQTVCIDSQTGEVRVDGVLLQEDYISTPTLPRDLTVKVDAGCVFVMGDNRMNSKDSRSNEIGQIDTREILGKAIFLFLPGPDPLTKSRDLSRIGVVS